MGCKWLHICPGFPLPAVLPEWWQVHSFFAFWHTISRLEFFPSKLFISTAFGPLGHTYHFTFFQVRKIASNLKFKIVELSGGKNDNYVFKKGLKKIIFDLFLVLTQPLALVYPQIFSDHIFGVFKNTQSTLLDKNRFELGN